MMPVPTPVPVLEEELRQVISEIPALEQKITVLTQCLADCEQTLHDKKTLQTTWKAMAAAGTKALGTNVLERYGMFSIFDDAICKEIEAARLKMNNVHDKLKASQDALAKVQAWCVEAKKNVDFRNQETGMREFLHHAIKVL
ncbi:hypothetical protein EBT25_16010 [bacterium]|jgi:prefoldin subunit 5|nr:hypothetical protein [bacterium]